VGECAEVVCAVAERRALVGVTDLAHSSLPLPIPHAMRAFV